MNYDPLNMIIPSSMTYDVQIKTAHFAKCYAICKKNLKKKPESEVHTKEFDSLRIRRKKKLLSKLT